MPFRHVRWVRVPLFSRVLFASPEPRPFSARFAEFDAGNWGKSDIKLCKTE